MTAAEAARAEGRCADVRVEAGQVLRLDPKNLLIRDLSRLCRARPDLAAAAVARPVRTRQVSTITAADRGEAPRRAEAGKSDGAEPAAKAETADADDAEALMKQAREAWLRQQCGAAMDLSRRALKAKPGWTDAYQILAVCSCSLKDADAAEHAYARLDDRNRSLVHAVCQKNGISVGQSASGSPQPRSGPSSSGFLRELGVRLVGRRGCLDRQVRRGPAGAADAAHAVLLAVEAAAHVDDARVASGLQQGRCLQ